MNSSFDTDLTFKDPSIFLYSKLTFSEARDSINTSLTSGSVTYIFIVLGNLCEKSLQDSLGPCMTLVYDSIFFLVLEFWLKHSRHMDKIVSSLTADQHNGTCQ